MTTTYEAAARQRKVIALVHALDRLPNPVDADLLPCLGDDFWEGLARLARVNPPSPATRAAVTEVVRHRVAVPADPFEGLGVL